MKILTVVFNLEKGGVQRTAQNFAEGYYKLGHDSRILCAYKLEIRAKELKHENIKIYYPLNDSTLKYIGKWGPDIIHIHSHGIKHNDIMKIKKYIPIHCLLKKMFFLFLLLILLY